MKRSRKIALMTGTLAALFFFGYILMMRQLGIGWQGSLAAGLCMGTYAASISSFSYWMMGRWHRKALSGKKQASDSLHEQSTVEIDLPYDAAFDLALAALQTLDGQYARIPMPGMAWFGRLMRNKMFVRLDEQQRAIGTIRAGMRKSILGISSFVDSSRLTLALEKIDATTTRIHIDSSPRLPFQIYDMGANLHYVNSIALYLRRESQANTAEARLSDDNLAHEDETSAQFQKSNQSPPADYPAAKSRP